MCGPSGSGKSTWVAEQIEDAKVTSKVVSRDAVRFSTLKDGEDYFAHENEVFEEFCKQINAALADKTGPTNVFVDATHLNEKSRNKTLDKLDLEGVDLYAVSFEVPVEICLEQNEFRSGRAYVPRSVIRRMCAQFDPPHNGEKYEYTILTVVNEEDNE